MTKADARIPVRVTVGAVKIHGPNSSIAEEGHREVLETEGPILTEITYKEAVSMLGEKAADELFAGISKEDR